MTRKLDQPPTPTREVVAESKSFQTIAKRIGSLATNILVTGVILIAGIAFGREVVSWWRGDSGSSNVSTASAVVGNAVSIAESDRQLLEFGDFPYVLNRQEFVGDVTGVLQSLRTACRTAVDSSEPLARNFSSAERRMLDATKRLTPVDEQANRWSIYQIEKPLPMVVGVRTIDLQVATSNRRVVSWGLAVPEVTLASEQQSEWTLFTCSSDTTAESTPDKLIQSAPPGGHRTLSVQTERGGALVGFAGVGTVESWTTFYDDLFAEPPYQAVDDWQVIFGQRRRRFAIAGTETVDVVIRVDDSDTLRGLVITSSSKMFGR